MIPVFFAILVIATFVIIIWANAVLKDSDPDPGSDYESDSEKQD